MMMRRSWFVFGTLIAIWIALIGWQCVEHIQARRAEQQKLVDRAKVVSNTVGLLLRSKSFFGIISPERLESALNELIKPSGPSEFHPLSIEVVNADYEKIASAGPPIDVPRGEVTGGIRWDDKAHTLTLQNLVDLGTNWTNVSVVGSPGEIFTNGPPRRGDSNGPPGFDRGEGRPPPDRGRGGEFRPPSPEGSNATAVSQLATISTNAGGATTNGETRRRRRRDPERPFERPSWMSQEQYQAILQKKGVHAFTMVMSTQSLDAPLVADSWLRGIIILLGAIAVAGYALAWRNAERTSELQIRLVRASELNSHLKEMNLAAAGLAHETRNPLNIVRGLAQMVSRRPDASPEIKEKAKQMIDETDRVTAQLNEFINYSRPREVRRAATNLNSVVADVARALNYDLEEKKVKLQVAAEPMTIEADEQLLRQALFNLVLNAVQAVPQNGEIQIRAARQNGNGAHFEVADNGPGVATENRTEIFKPYFTTHTEGTGLGLAVVQQIVLAHGWEIACLPNQPSGAVFRITHLKLAGKPS
jgi:signal transduction histidine kinase